MSCNCPRCAIVVLVHRVLCCTGTVGLSLCACCARRSVPQSRGVSCDFPPLPALSTAHAPYVQVSTSPHRHHSRCYLGRDTAQTCGRAWSDRVGWCTRWVVVTRHWPRVVASCDTAPPGAAVYGNPSCSAAGVTVPLPSPRPRRALKQCRAHCFDFVLCGSLLPVAVMAGRPCRLGSPVEWWWCGVVPFRL